MDLTLVGGAIGVLLIGIVYLYLTRKKTVNIYHIGALKTAKDIIGKKIFIYGFVNPVYGRAVRITGFGGTIKGRCDTIPSGGTVLEGVFENNIFTVQKIVKKMPIDWRINWINPSRSRKLIKPHNTS